MTRRDFGKVAVLMGGPSAERAVSLKSGAAVVAALQRRGVDAHGVDADSAVLAMLAREKFTRVFIALHGRWGEDGVIQGGLEVIGLPYTGSGVLASALGMDKLRCKQLWTTLGVPTPPYAVLTADTNFDDVVRRLGLPLFVKPGREGSSIGMTKVKAVSELKPAYVLAAKYDTTVIAEQFIAGQELTAAILGGAELPLVGIETAREFYDYEAKYLLDDTRYHCPCGLDAALERRIQKLARQAFTAIGAHGWGRVDVMLDREHNPYVLEINTVPGMTDHSLVPKAAHAAGIDFDELVVRILETSRDAR